jgi:hypothetical protein
MKYLRAYIVTGALAAGCTSPTSIGGTFDPDGGVIEKDAHTASDSPAPKDVPMTPDVPTTADVPTTVDVPTTPDVPTTADVPTTPDVPTTADVPTTVDVPTTPDVPAVEDVPPACAPGQFRCDGACVDPRVTAAHCGACGNACPAENDCVAGVCTPRCAPGQRLCGARCVDTQTAVTDCGACGTVCAPGANAAATCAAGACGIACAEGFGDCDGNAGNGCEVNVRESAAHCGRCGVQCPGGGLGVCAMGACSTRCMPGQTLCGASCVDILSSQENCGACGNSCGSAPNATGRCAFGACQLTCATNFGDCDRDPANGCETDLRTSVSHCGVCGTVCAPPPGGSPSCAMGRCSAVCPTGQTLCAGSCVDTQTDNAHCGACGNACGMFSRCGAGSCSIPVPPTRYVQATSTQAFLDACAAPGRTTHLASRDDGSETVTLPFAFRYWATNLTAGAMINITSNGWIGMLGAPDASLGGTIPSTGTPNGVIAPYWADNYTRAPGMCVATFGTAPNRQWVVEWLNAYHYASGSESLTFEVVLTETANTVDFVYQTMTGANASRVVGIESPDGALGVGGCAGGGYNCAPANGYRVRFTPAP